MGRPPDILWIVTTQWRARSCGWAAAPGAGGAGADPQVRTPALDALAARSVNYAQAVTPHPFSPFARAALLTGRPSPDNGVARYFDPLPPGARTIAHDMAERGYRTAFFGKWHLGVRDPQAPLVGEAHARTIVPEESRGGFGFWEGFESGFLLNGPWLHGTRLSVPACFPGYQPEVLADRFESWRAAAEDGSNGNGQGQGEGRARAPWFCVLSVETPHPPYDAPAAGARAGDGSLLTLPANVPRGGEVEARARRELAGYAAHIGATDRILGGLALRLSGRPVAPVLVVFTSVHGDMHGAHGHFRKGWPHEESVRVPLLVADPRGGRAASTGGDGGAGAVETAAASLLDLPAATRAWADGQPAQGGAGSLARPWSVLSMPQAVPLAHQCDRPWRALRTPARKLVLNADGSTWLHFDLEADPLERRNLAAEGSLDGERAELASRLVDRAVQAGT